VTYFLEISSSFEWRDLAGFGENHVATLLVVPSVATAVFFTRSGFLIKNLFFFDFGQFLEMYVVLLYFPFKETVVSEA